MPGSRPLLRTAAVLLALGATAAVGAPTAAQAAPLPAAAPTPAPVVDNSTRARALAAYRAHHQAAKTVATGWNGRTGSCSAGAPSAAAQRATLTTINYYRSMVGLRPTSFDPAWNAQAQKAALLVTANKALSHTPPRTWRCWTPAGAQAASSGNIGLGYATGASTVDAYLSDVGNDATLGHRRWILDPRITKMGNGQTSSGNALKLWHGRVPTAQPAGTPAYVAWPDSGFVPKTLVPGNKIWSFSASDAATDLSRAQVTVKAGGRAVPVRVTRPTPGYGKPAVGFALTTGYTGGPDKAYTVTVSGMRKGGRVLAPYTYTTTLFDPAFDVAPRAGVTSAPRVSTITWNVPSAVRVGQTFPLSATSTSGDRVTDYRLTVTGACAFSGWNITFKAKGSCTMTIRQGATPYFRAASLTKTFVVS